MLESMATRLVPSGPAVPLPAEAPPPGVPGLSVPDASRLVGPESRDPRTDADLARRVADAHTRALSSRKRHDLTTQKYMLHVDGEGGAQWADLYHGEELMVPLSLSSSQRPQENLLRPILLNAVAYDTTQPFRFAVESAGDPESRQRARMDALFANQLSQRQNFNLVAAEAEMFALCHGSAPMHVFWREDTAAGAWEPAYLPDGGAATPGPRRGMIDLFAGDPLDFVLNRGARRGSVHWASYGRTLPAEIVRQLAQRPDLVGSRRLGSAAQFQRTLRTWMADSLLGIHGSAAIGAVTDEDPEEELIALVCREWAPGADTQHPEGRLVVVALQGRATTSRTGGSQDSQGTGEAILLHDSALPGACFSWELLYGDTRFDDPLGKPFAADLDDLQMRLNGYLALGDEYVVRATSAPLVRPTGMSADTDLWEPDAELEVEPVQGAMPPYFLGPYDKHITFLEAKAEGCRQAMFRIGGYQAASRGESKSGDPAALVLALQQADKTIHGPRNQGFQRSVNGLMQKAWRQMKTFGDVPWLIDLAGEEATDLAEPYLDKTKLSENPPNYKLVNSFGVTPEAAAQELTGLVQLKGADGLPVLSTADYRARYPNASIFSETVDAAATKKRRANTINNRLRVAVSKARNAYGLPPYRPGDPPGPEVPQLAAMLWPGLVQAFPQKRDDDPQVHVDALSELTQDENEDPIVRALAEQRQGLYYAWQAQIAARAAAAQMAAAGGVGAPGNPNQPGAQGEGAPGASQRGVIPMNASPGAQIHGRVNQLSQQAQGAA